MSLDKIKEGLSAPIKKEESTPFNREAMGNYLLKKNEPHVTTTGWTRFKNDRKQEVTESTTEQITAPPTE